MFSLILSHTNFCPLRVKHKTVEIWNHCKIWLNRIGSMQAVILFCFSDCSKYTTEQNFKCILTTVSCQKKSYL